MSEQEDERLATERAGFFRMTAVALGANMAAATIHSGQRLNWKGKLVPDAMEGAKAFWEALQEDKRSQG